MDDPNQPIGRLLVVDDDRDIRELLRGQLVRAGFTVETAGDVREAEAILTARAIDVVVLDLTLPDRDGMELCRELVAAASRPAILIVSARDAAADRVIGLETGADDYLVKPFEPRELVARVRNLLRRVNGPDPKLHERGARFACFGPWRLDLIKRRLVTGNDSVVMLSTAEFDMLLRFIRKPREAIGREDLVPERRETVWLDRSLDNRVHRIRQKLAQLPGGDDLIVTVRNQGYCLASDVRFQ